MASKVSGLGIGIRKATPADLNRIQIDIESFNMPLPELYKVQPFKNETTFIAFSGKTIMGFITVQENSLKQIHVEGFYHRLGYDRRGIGSKLLGKVEAYAVAKGLTKITLTPSSGYAIKDGRKVRIYADKFYAKTNLIKSRTAGQLISGYVWEVKGKQWIRPRTPKQTLSIGLAPQNLLRQDARLKRRRR